jgi:SWIM zinc finger
MIKFLVQGSDPAPYEVVFDRKGDSVGATCSCPAGMKGPVGQCCKHRIAILCGDGDGIVSPNASDVKIVRGWIAGSDIEIALTQLTEGEVEREKARRKVAAAKKALAKVMGK